MISKDSVMAAQPWADHYKSIFPDLKPGKNGWAESIPCPFHAEKDPSFSVNLDHGGFCCFGCQEKGDFFKFVRKFHGLSSFPDVLNFIGRAHGIGEVPGPEARMMRERAAAGKRKRAAMTQFLAWRSRKQSLLLRICNISKGLMTGDLYLDDPDLYAWLANRLLMWEYWADLLAFGEAADQIFVKKEMEHG